MSKNNSKIEIDIPDDVKWEAIGKGIALGLMEKQERIGCLEQMIWWLYENICMGNKSSMLDSDDVEMCFCKDILDKFKELNKK